MAKRDIDVAFIIKRNDETGKPMTRTLDDGRVVPDPMLQTVNYGIGSDLQVRCSLWDLDSETLAPLLPNGGEGQSFEEFHRLMHDRMQELVQQGRIASMITEHDQARRIRDLEARIAKAGAND